MHTYGGQTGGQELYVDGNLVAKGERTYSFLNYANDIHIGGGGSEDNSMESYRGYIDSLYMYDSSFGGE